MQKNKSPKTKIFALGGLGEIGKNAYCIEHENEIILIDAGVKFPENELLGIDYVIADFSYLVENQNKLKALIITHGHEDHIGGIPFLVKQLNVPVIYCPKLTHSLILKKLDNNRIRYKGDFVIYEEDTIFKSKHFKVEFYRTNHSIPDSFGLSATTVNGTIVHTGDFKFDFTPIGEHANLAKMARIGAEGVTLLLSDSTGAEVPGFTLSESVVDAGVAEIFRTTYERIIIATFASNVHRLKHIIETSVKYNRKIAVFGRSMENIIKVALEQKYIDVPKEFFVDGNKLKNLKKNEITILCTGSQGEPLAALSRIAAGTHKQIKLIPGDSIIFSSSPIPGNLSSVSNTINQLYRGGAIVYTNTLSPIHASGHGAQEELKLMLRLMTPKYFMPIHGEYRMLRLHGDMGVATGVAKENVFVLGNGDVLEMVDQKIKQGESIPNQDIYIDGNGIGDIGTVVLNDRKLLSANGTIIITFTVDLKEHRLLSRPSIVARGFVHIKENEALLTAITIECDRYLKQQVKNPKLTINALKSGLIYNIGQFLTKKKYNIPVILPVVLDVTKHAKNNA